MADDFKRLFMQLVETWDHQFPRCSTSFAADLAAAELLADFNKLIRARESDWVGVAEHFRSA